MAVFIANFRGTYSKQFVYRLPAVATCLGSVISVLVQIALWMYLYQNDPQNSAYMAGYVVLARLLACLHDSDIAKSIEKRVRSGDLAIDLIRPVDISLIFWSEAAGNAAARLALRGLPILLLFGIVFFRLSITIKGTLLFFTAALLGWFVYNSIYMTIGYLAFVVTMNWPYIRIANDTMRLLSGSVVPVALFPPVLRAISWCVPFRLFYAFPIDLMLGGLTGREVFTGFFLLMLWAVLCYLWLRLTIRAVQTRLTIQGG